MNRKSTKIISITQKNDATCSHVDSRNRRKKLKRNASKKLRQFFKKEEKND